MLKVFEIIGEYLTLMYRSVAKPEKGGMYWKETLRQAQDIGIGSVTIIAIVSTFVGGVSAVQFAYQFRSLNIVPMWWIGSIVRKSMVLELAPTISALLLAGKVGSNIASELGTMRISEQIDAYEIMGVNTPAYLIGPKLAASIVVVPMLVVIAVFLGITGGWWAGILGNFYTSAEYFRGVQDEFNSHDVSVMLVKATLFGFIITSVSCYKGFTVRGGAVEIGHSSTQAVVYSSIIIMIVNFLVAFLLL